MQLVNSRRDTVTYEYHRIINMYTDDDKKAVMTFVNSLKTLNVTMIGTEASNDMLRKFMFNDDQDLIIKFMITLISTLNEYDEFFNTNHSFLNAYSSVILHDIFTDDFRKLTRSGVLKTDWFEETIAYFILGA